MIEKTVEAKRPVIEEDARTGEDKVRWVEPYEIKATGKDCMELMGAFKDSKDAMLHEQSIAWDRVGETKITLPNGQVDTVRADKEQLYRNQPGCCKHATRPTFVVDVPWEGRAKREGFWKQKQTATHTETFWNDGRHTIEERP